MKKKLIAGIMAIAISAACAAGLTACGKNGESGDKWGNVYTVEAAYKQAKDLGYSGTLEEFIDSISGKDGVGITEALINSDGELIIIFSNGTTANLGKVAGKDGDDGLSAFEIYKKYHPEYEGTEEEWIESLKGSDGVGVRNTYINDDGELIVELTDGTKINCGRVVPDINQMQLKFKAIEDDGEIKAYSVAGFVMVFDEDVTIPKTHKGKPVISIEDNAFLNNEEITSVTIPDSVTTIGCGAFEYCVNLKSVTIGNGVTTIGHHAFYNSQNIEKIIFESGSKLTEIENYAFSKCRGIESIKIPESVTNMGAGVFTDCRGLKSLVIPNSVTTIGSYLLSGCTGLENVTISENLTETGLGMLSGCTSLTSVNFGENSKLTAIEDYMFSGCKSLERITLPKGVNYFGFRAFYECAELKEIFFSGTKAEWEEARKIPFWDSYAGNYTVHCTDGDIVKE